MENRRRALRRLASHPEHAIARRQMRGFGGVVSFEFKGDLDATSRVVDGCRIPQIAPSSAASRA